MNIRHGSLLLATAFAIPVWAAPSKPIALALKLPSKTAAAAPAVSAAIAGKSVKLQLADARHAAEPDVVGSQHEKETEIYLWRSKGAVAPAVQAIAGQVLREWKIRTAADADLELSLELEKYWVDEASVTFGSAYTADVAIAAKLVDRAGQVVWTGRGTGTAKRTAVDGRASTCNELLSLALRDALAGIVAAPSGETAPLGLAVSPTDAARVPAGAAGGAAVAAPGTVDPSVLFDDLVRLSSGGVTDDVLVSYVKQHRPSRALNVDEILAWKNAGIPDAAIKAAVGN